MWNPAYPLHKGCVDLMFCMKIIGESVPAVTSDLYCPEKTLEAWDKQNGDRVNDLSHSHGIPCPFGLANPV